MHGTTASYKLMHRFGKTVKDKLKDKVRSTVFSPNLDEAASNNSLHVLTLLVSYYDLGQNDVVTNHLASVNMPSVDASSLFDKIKEIFENYNLCLSQNCWPCSWIAVLSREERRVGLKPRFVRWHPI